MLRLQVDIAALQETRLPDNGSLKEESYTFFWKGQSADERRDYGVAFAVRNTLLKKIEPPTGGSSRLLTMRLMTETGPVTLVTAYAPTLAASSESKDQFYCELDELLNNIPKKDHIYLLGDFNARVGSNHEAWPECLGHHGIGKINDNGQRLLELCSNHHLCTTSSFFPNKVHQRASWMHPRSKHWHQLDHVITSRSQLCTVRNTRTYHSADCNTDHSLVLSKVILKPRPFHLSKPKSLPRINTGNTNCPERTNSFLASLRRSINSSSSHTTASAKWKQLSQSIFDCALESYGKKQGKTNDWYEANKAKLEPVLEARRSALLDYKSNPCKETLACLQLARKKVKTLSRYCANDFWCKLCDSIERAAQSGNIGRMYEGIKAAFGPQTIKTAPIKSKDGHPISDGKLQLKRWTEHYLELYSTKNIITDEALNSIPQLSVLLHLDEEPSMEEFEDAYDHLTKGKAPGGDLIPPEVLIAGKSVLLQPLYELLCLCWEEKEVPQSMRDSKISTLFKNKGDRGDCDNYRGISLLSIVGKVFARVILKRLQILADRVLPESQCGFRSKRSTIDMISAVRLLQEKCREQSQPLFAAFVDLTKAFDLVSRTGLSQVLQKIGCPPTLLSLIMSFHTNMKGVVSFNGEESDPFPISSGVKQGCVLAPVLFAIFFSVLLNYAFKDSTDGVPIQSRTDGGLLNIKRFGAKTKISQHLIRELLFADDAALVSHSRQGLQRLLDDFSKACRDFGLTISVKKTEVMTQNTTSDPSISVNDCILKVVDQFKYLGSTISRNLSLDSEINIRIGKAASAQAKLNERVWENKNLTINTKMRVYRACVLSTLLYGSETWSTYTSQENKLNAFHLRSLRRILGISWSDRISNEAVHNKSCIPSIQAILSKHRLRWLGHVKRMDDSRLPKLLLFGQLATGTRAVGRPRLRFIDACKRDMKQCGINLNTWEKTALNRNAWRKSINAGTSMVQNKQSKQKREKRQRLAAKKTSSSTATNNSFVCPRCSRVCRSRIGLYSHERACAASNNMLNN